MHRGDLKEAWRLIRGIMGREDQESMLEAY